ncbi:hypothetical protein A4R44_03569 [Amycolatopsis sp. M39]|nr:hypothetical protein A4R44_03569 [Amycolatopsis sp. M39]
MLFGGLYYTPIKITTQLRVSPIVRMGITLETFSDIDVLGVHQDDMFAIILQFRDDSGKLAVKFVDPRLQARFTRGGQLSDNNHGFRRVFLHMLD